MQVKLGTLEQDEAEVEWVLRPYMNTAKKRKFLGEWYDNMLKRTIRYFQIPFYLLILLKELFNLLCDREYCGKLLWA